MSSQPLILVTNDDGIDSLGLKELAVQLSGLADVLVVAPVSKQSGAGRGFPRGPLYNGTGEMVAHTLSEGEVHISAYALHGTPAACVAHAIFEICDEGRKPDLCVSGINYGGNLGLGVYASGTVGAALEAVTHGVPSLAMSQLLPAHEDRPARDDSEGWRALFRPAALIATRFAHEMMVGELAGQMRCLNVNVPPGADLDTPIDVVDQAPTLGWTWDRVDRDDIGEPAELQYSRGDLDLVPGSDWHAIGQGHVTVTPLTPVMQDFSVDLGDLSRSLGASRQ